jgi:hypothetical protein
VDERVSAEARVTIVAVHGIADQRPGQTVREIARLLCHGGDGAPRFVQGEMHDVLVPVEKLEPGGTPVAAPAPGSNARGDKQAAELCRRRPGTPSGFYQTQQSAPAAPAAISATQPDLGIALNDYLLGRLALSEGEVLYESTRISLRHRADDRAVDVYELYWADLSRLRTGGVRALSALYQLFFHLGTLAADVVDQIALSAGSSPAWRTLQRLHAWSAWLMKAPAAIVQLSMLLLAVFGTTVFVPREQQGQLLAALFGMGAIALVTLGSPLRDLYAERFPLLYQWMGSNDAGFASAAPSAADLGATEWVNACRSGDYVGRFIWTSPGDAARFRIAVVGSDGKVEAQRAGDRTEFCLGAGGHTHYFNNDAAALAVEIERLITR